MMRKGIVLTIHSAAGLLAGLFILLMSLSGALLVFHEQFDQGQWPVVKTEKYQPVIMLDSCWNILRRQYPHGEISNCHLAKSTSQPYIFSVYDSSFKEGKEALKVYMHPQSGAILKTSGNRAGLISWMDRLHTNLHLGKTGEWLLGFFALVFLLSIITGLILYRKKIAAVLLFRKSVFRKATLHQLVGVYALLFNLMIAFSGFWMQRYVFKKDFYKPNKYKPVIKPSAPLYFGLDKSLKQLTHSQPAFVPYVIYFARQKKSNTVIYGSRIGNSFIHSKEFADAVFLDSTGAVAFTGFVDELDPSTRYDIINSQLHMGSYGGWPIKIIYAVFGLTGSILSITGFLIWLRKKRRKAGG